jgi:hydroxyacylglutathione hydrolase
VAYFGHGVLFCGDTLFSLGCGRLFEGTPAQMVASLDRLAALPADTHVCCGHEYTVANAAFARVVDPDNQALAERSDDPRILQKRQPRQQWYRIELQGRLSTQTKNQARDDKPP